MGANYLAWAGVAYFFVLGRWLHINWRTLDSRFALSVPGREVGL